MAAVPEPSSLGADRMAARLNSPVISSNGPALPGAIAPGPALKVRVEEQFHIPAQTSLIAFQADHVIGLPSNDPPANPAPASHRINGHDGTLDRQKGRQFDLSSTLRCFGTGFRSRARAEITGPKSPGRNHQAEITRPKSPGRNHQAEITRPKSPGRNHQAEITRPKSPGRNHQAEITGPKSCEWRPCRRRCQMSGAAFRRHWRHPPSSTSCKRTTRIMKHC